MIDEKYSIDELVLKVNKILLEKNLNSSYQDSRIRQEFSTRRVRDLITKELISKPFKDKNRNYYTEVHLEELLNLKELQNQGISDKVMLSLKSETDVNFENNSNKNFDNRSLFGSEESGNSSLLHSMSKYSKSPSFSEMRCDNDFLKSLSGLNTIDKNEISDNQLSSNIFKALDITSDIENEKIRSFLDNSITVTSYNEFELSKEVILKVNTSVDAKEIQEIIEEYKKNKNNK